MRCPICGRPDNDAELLDREVKCGGCIADLKALLAEMVPVLDASGQPTKDLVPRYTNEQAVAIAAQRHREREWAVHEALVGKGSRLEIANRAKDVADAAAAAVSK